jgi:CheY-like chemotaxis protein
MKNFTSENPDFSGLRVLFAEDDPVSQRLVSRLLEKTGIELTVVSDGEAAWEALQEGTFDLALLDIQMPKCSGLDLVERIRASEDYPDLFLCAITAHGLEEELRKFEEAGFHHCLTKPVSRAVLYNGLQAVVRFMSGLTTSSLQEHHSSEHHASPQSLSTPKKS